MPETQESSETPSVRQPPPPRTLAKKILRYVMRLQSRTLPCTSWTLEPERRAEVERTAARLMGEVPHEDRD